MPFYDLREYLQKLENQGELVRVKTEVDWNLEASAICRRAQELRVPAPLFEKVRGYPEGFRLFGNPVGPTRPSLHGRLALALGLPKDTGALELIKEFSHRLERPIKPVLVEDGPCKENVITGEQVNVLKFPAPFIHSFDGGRFIGTWHLDIVKDPDTGWVNWGTYRHMVHDERSLGFLALPQQHGPSIYYEKYYRRGKNMPMAVVIGTDPVCTIAAASQIPAGVDEADVAGALRREPVELVKCETCDLEVPASAEIVLEGEVTEERKTEGPFGEYTGYSAEPGVLSPVFKVNCITHRNSPILPFSVFAKPWDDGGVVNSIQLSSCLYRELKRAGVPFKSVFVLPHILAVIVSTKASYPGFIHTLSSAIWGSKPGMLRPYIIIVGEDVDVTSADDVLWCLTTRWHPALGTHVQKGAPCIPLWPYITPEERTLGRSCRVALDATFPVEWPEEQTPKIVDFERAWPEEVREKVVARWQVYGFD